MSIYSIIATFTTTINLIIGIYTLALNPKKTSNILFALLSLCSVIWGVGAIWSYSAKNIDEVIFFYKFSGFGFFSFYSFLLLFIISFTGLRKPTAPLFIIILLPTAIFIFFQQFLSLRIFDDFIKINGEWCYKIYTNNYFNYLYMIYFSIYISASIFIALKWGKKSSLYREKKIAKILITSFLSAFIIGFIDSIIIPYFFHIPKPALAPITIIIVKISIFYTITQLDFLKISPSLAVNDIISSIDELIILLDCDYKIMSINNKMESVFNTNIKEIAGNIIFDSFIEKERIKNEMERLKSSVTNSLSARVHYILQNEKNIFLDIKLSKIFDKNNDLIGFLIIGSVIKELNQFQEKFKISERESEIIFLIMSGATREEISKKLNISINTVRTHITNIFNKLGVNNKMEALYVLREYKLMPEKDSDKFLFFGNK